MAEESIISYSDLIGDDGTFEDISKHIDKLKKELVDLAKVQKKAISKISPNDSEGVEKMTKEVRELATAKKKLDQVEKAATVAKKKNIQLTNEELIQREKEKLANRERVQIAKQTAIIRRAEKKSIESIRAQLSLTTLQWKKLTAGELKNTKIGKDLVKNKRNLTKELKKLEKATGDNRRNVGNYSSALSGLNGVMVGFGGNIGVTVGAFRSLGGLLKTVALGFKTLRGAIISTGIGALVVAFGALVTFLSRTQRGLDFVNRAFTAVTTTIDVIIDRISKFGEAIGAAFSGDFAKAARLFKESVSGVGDEIAKEVKAADDLEKALQALAKREIEFIKVKSARGRQIAELERLAEENKNNDKKRSEEQLREAIKLQQGISDTEVAIAKERARIKTQQIALSESTNDDLREEAELIAAVDDVEKQREDRIRGLTRKLNSLIGVKKESNKVDKETIKLTNERIKAIEEVQKKIEKAEVDNIKDKRERLLALEELRFKEEQSLRVEQFTRLVELTKEQDGDLKEVQQLNYELEQLQLETSEQKKLAIRKQFAIETINIQSFTADEFKAQADKEAEDLRKANEAKLGINDEYLESIAEANEANRLDEEARNKAAVQSRKDATKQLLDDITKSAQKIGDIIVGLFEKQADLSKEAVNSQVSNLENARDRAAKGLTNNLAFEEAELSKRQAEQQRREKEAAQAARLLSLFNLVSAYAGSGDKNALARGLVDWSILEALAQGIGFEEGGFTGTGGTSEVAGVVHGKEFVVTAADTAKYNLTGKSGDDFGSAMSDYYNPQSPVLQNPYQTQKQAFENSTKQTAQSSNKDVINELKAIKEQLASQPNLSAEIVKMYEGVYGLVKEESRRNMKVITRTKLKERL